MPNVIRSLSTYIQSGNPDLLALPVTQPQGGSGAQSGIYAPGDLGQSFDLYDKTYEMVIVDSGATAATPVGAVAANQVLFWKDKGNRIVTNDSRFAQNSSGVANAYRNMVAGIARIAVPTPGPYGTYIAMLARGHGIPVACDGTGAIGDIAIASATTTVAQCTGVTVGTGPGYVPLGVMVSAVANNLVNVDVDIPVLA
jgi:hypothetical protein